MNDFISMTIVSSDWREVSVNLQANHQSAPLSGSTFWAFPNLSREHETFSRLRFIYSGICSNPNVLSVKRWTLNNHAVREDSTKNHDPRWL